MQASDSDSQHYDGPRVYPALLIPRVICSPRPTPCVGARAIPELERAENTIVNRPFSAFGTLMTLLALAMFAVSSTSRSTTVKPLPRSRGSGVRSQQGGFEVSDQKPAVRGRRPAAGGSKSEIRNKQLVVNSQSAATARSPALKSLSARNRHKQAPALHPVRMMMAENSLARMRTESMMDYRSHYDPTYDLTVYGIKDAAANMPPAEMESQALSANLPGELDFIFHELASRQPRRPSPQTGAMKVDRNGLRWSSLATAAGGWLKYQASRVMEIGAPMRQTEVSAPPVGWAEYAEFADGAIARNAATIEAAGTSDTKLGVRSSDWLRHFAASSLHQWSLLLKAAAEEVDAAEWPALSAIGN